MAMNGIGRRAAEILRDHGGPYVSRSDLGAACDCGWEGENPRDGWSAHVAAALVPELGLDRFETARKAFIALTEAWAELRMDTAKDQALHDQLVAISRGAAALVPSWD